MQSRLQREIDGLKKKLLSLGAEVEERVRMAVSSVKERDEELARRVIEGDDVINEAEVELEEEGLKVLALYQPVAVDLRFIIALLKINNDIERIGDLAADIAERTVQLCSMEPGRFGFNYVLMAEKAQEMLNQSLDALVNLNVEAAYKVLEKDQEVDDMHRASYGLVQEEVMQNPSVFSVLAPFLSISKHLERIADLATNIAEDVIYLASGEIVRHCGSSSGRDGEGDG